MKMTVWAFLITAVAIPCIAAVPGQVRVEGILRQPLAQRIESLNQNKKESREQLEGLAFDSTQRLDARWRAVTAMGRIYSKESRPALDKALSSPEWFMRNAAVVVLPYGERAWAIGWARVLLHDPALVVRTAAVQAIRQMQATETEPLLWEKLYSSENYRGGQSLWIRRHILETLNEFNSSPKARSSTAERKARAEKYRVLLKDKDASLHALAMVGLHTVEATTAAQKPSSVTGRF